MGRNTGLNGVANGLQSNILDKPVVDQTGLTGRYDFQLRFTPDAIQLANFGGLEPANAADLNAPPDIFTAFEQQLGLKLQAGPGYRRDFRMSSSLAGVDGSRSRCGYRSPSR